MDSITVSDCHCDCHDSSATNAHEARDYIPLYLNAALQAVILKFGKNDWKVLMLPINKLDEYQEPTTRDCENVIGKYVVIHWYHHSLVANRIKFRLCSKNINMS